MNKLGFSVIYSPERDQKFYADLLDDMLTAGCDAIELHTPRHTKIDDPVLLRLIGEFGYRAVHTSDLHSPAQDAEVLAFYKDLTQQIGAAAVTIHPHTMQEWGWIADYFGDQASFENMDRFKPFGKTPEDMQRIKSEHPTARWTFDLNHVFTNDESLSRVPDFYAQLDNPGHYHISGFQDETLPHATLHSTQQDEIIRAVATDAPIIIESLGMKNIEHLGIKIRDITSFREEYDYVLARLQG